jgi:diacylglycerol kinase (ATP)
MTSVPLRIVVAVNPSASFGHRGDVAPRVLRALADAGHIVVPLVADSFATLVAACERELATAPDALVVVGGDGMVNLGAALTAETGIPLGLVPSGTGNDMARALGIPHDHPVAAIRMLVDALTRPPRVIDAGRIRAADGARSWFACTASAGFDALVNERANRMRWPRGPRRYTLALVAELLRLRHVDYELVLDGVASAVRGTLVSVGNGVSFGGGIRVLPNAVLDDGLLDVLVVERLTRVQFLRVFPRVARGAHLGDPRVHVHRVKTVSIAAADVVAYADGERVGPLPIEVEVVPGALRMLAPAPVS